MMVQIVTAKDDRIGKLLKCERCGATTREVAPSHGSERSVPISENEDGTAHASTCSERVRVAQVVHRPKRTDIGRGLDALLPAVKR